ncbi:MAG: sulfatase-like hydrolase/transferase [Planctomycetes bacterium]|nr:sulfatase-like hydrolase/transferase [Planctomycetota bacterium]
MRNIILLITDTYRYDNLGNRAERPVRSPYLDRFIAERATEVHGSYVGSFPTIPHRTDVATGVCGWPHYGWQAIELSSPNHIAAMLGQAGYATQLLCDCPHLFKARFNEKFDAAYQNRGQEADRPLLRLNEEIVNVMPDEKTRTRPRFRDHTLVDVHRWVNHYSTSEFDKFPAKTGMLTMKWLEENHNAGPFFLWVDFFDPHEPWDAPEYLVKRYDPDYTGTPMLHPNYGPASAFTDAELKNLWAHYAAESELVDRWLGRVLEKIDDLGLWDDSIVLVTADHGMSVGEHERTGKSNIHDTDPRYWPIYPEIGHTPCLVAGGDVPKRQSLDLFVSPMDLLPTMAELAGAKVNPPKPFDGKSFAKAILNGEAKHRDYVVSGCCVRSKEGKRPRKAVTPFLVTREWGYAPVGAYGRRELYDMTKDPLAANDIAAENEGVVAEMHELFLSHLREHGASEEFMALWGDAKEGAGEWAIDYPDKTV